MEFYRFPIFIEKSETVLDQAISKLIGVSGNSRISESISLIDSESHTFTIPAGGTLFVYTDGAAEAMNESDEQFGLERMEETLNRYSGLDPKELIE